MKIYNTLSNQIEEFEPIDPPHVGLYACGFTVYDYTHLGHLRKYTMDDVLIRTLEHAGFEVKHVQNVTDVGHLASDADTGEDKLEKGAKKYDRSVSEIAHQFEQYFYRSMDLMNNERPDVVCHAADHIKDMLGLVKKLEKEGYTYEIEGDGIYFDTSKLEDYGKLADLDLEGLQEGARVEKVKGKRNATDFALWKFERPGENRAMAWESPWEERSFPGWHIECSAMSMKYLGPQFDIHTGGIDHIPVHHTNEIAQSEAATGKKPFVKYWVHHNHLMVEGEKMSKSKENFFTIDDVIEQGFEAAALRLLFLGAHYRSQQNFTWDSLAAAQTSWEKLKRHINDWRTEVGDEVTPPVLSAQAQALAERFFALVEDDLKTPEAMAVFWEAVNSDLPAGQKLKLVLDFDQVLGLEVKQAEAKDTKVDFQQLPPEVQKLVERRAEARGREEWDQADQLRAEIKEQGYQAIDTKQGQILRKED